MITLMEIIDLMIILAPRLFADRMKKVDNIQTLKESRV